jgi:hypothetical protein
MFVRESRSISVTPKICTRAREYETPVA